MASATDTNGDPSAPRPASRTLRVTLWVAAVLAIVLLFAGALAYHTAAAASYHASFDATASLANRAAAASRAARLEPWDSTYATRRTVMEDWVKGKQLLDAGDYNPAVDILAVAYRNDIGDAELLALFQRAQQVQSLATVRKAHLQHGHEGPGGTLRPQDIER